MPCRPRRPAVGKGAWGHRHTEDLLKEEVHRIARRVEAAMATRARDVLQAEGICGGCAKFFLYSASLRLQARLLVAGKMVAESDN